MCDLKSANFAVRRARESQSVAVRRGLELRRELVKAPIGSGERFSPSSSYARAM